MCLSEYLSLNLTLLSPFLQINVDLWNITSNSLDIFQEEARFFVVAMEVAAEESVLMWAPSATHTRTCTQQPATTSSSQTVTGSNLWFLLGQLLVLCLPVSSPGCSEWKTQYLIRFFSLLALNTLRTVLLNCLKCTFPGFNWEWGQVSINIRQQDHSETGSMYCIINL